MGRDNRQSLTSRPQIPSEKTDGNESITISWRQTEMKEHRGERTTQDGDLKQKQNLKQVLKHSWAPAYSGRKDIPDVKSACAKAQQGCKQACCSQARQVGASAAVYHACIRHKRRHKTHMQASIWSLQEDHTPLSEGTRMQTWFLSITHRHLFYLLKEDR